MSAIEPTHGRAEVETEIARLREQLAEATQTIEAIQGGNVDALVIDSAEGQRIFSLAGAERPYRLLIEEMREGALTLASDGIVLYSNRALGAMLEFSPDHLVGTQFEHLVALPDQNRYQTLIKNLSRGEVTLIGADAREVPVSLSFTCLGKNGEFSVCCVVTDLTDAHRHTQEMAKTEAALRQAQKMEAVGQLTGGLAHDFNNLLAGISGSLELLQTRINQGRLGDLERYINAAQGAAKRAASLTHRLLAFSRQQTLDPKPIDVNRLIAGMEDLIRRSIGPQITLDVLTVGGLWPTLLDAGQLENALLNLCINARDAMPGGGRITVETANKWLDERAAKERDLDPGQYLSLCVTDTGTGMSAKTIARVFDPFFTTKPVGQGTGLGLSMVYGFVRQSGGQVRIYSELGQGTTVCLYFPRHHSEAEQDEPLTGEAITPSRALEGQMVLIVDDEPTMRMLVIEVLEDLGYQAIEASDGPSGTRILQSDVRIDLLITDVGLPGGMNGRQLADAARVSRPELKILFITGYAENSVIGNGHLAPGMQILTKPFAMETLATRVRDLIGT